jgi:uncharacterized membrane protein YeaQ/YmgE (transglycosylase-associated protein family)
MMAVPQKQHTQGDYPMGKMDARALLVFLGIGLLAGFLASLIVGGSGLLTYLLSGVIGSFVGGYLFSALNINLGIRNDLVRQIITSTVGAIIVLLVARLIAG